MSLEVGQEELGSRAEGLVRRSCGRRNGRGQAHGRRGGGRRQPKTRRRPTAAAGPSEAPNPVSAASRFGGVRAAASRLPAREATGVTAAGMWGGGSTDREVLGGRGGGFRPAGLRAGERARAGKEVAVGRSGWRLVLEQMHLVM